MKIGSQVWMAENLDFETRNSWCFENKSSNCRQYGRLYDWNAAMRACPAGWHLPDDREIERMMSAIGGKSEARKKLMTKSGCSNGSIGSDTWGFSLLPAGSRDENGAFRNMERNANFWSSSEFSNTDATRWDINCIYDYASSRERNKKRAFSVRCIRD